MKNSNNQALNKIDQDQSDSEISSSSLSSKSESTENSMEDNSNINENQKKNKKKETNYQDYSPKSSRYAKSQYSIRNDDHFSQKNSVSLEHATARDNNGKPVDRKMKKDKREKKDRESSDKKSAQYHEGGEMIFPKEKML